MAEFRNGFEFLDHLREQTRQENLSFDSLKRYLSVKASEKGIPTNGIFELTPLCNFDCRMCYTHLQTDQLRDRQLLSVDQWKSLMHDAWEAGMMFAGLTGGECLTYPGFRELYLYLRSLGIHVSILTNGSLLDEDWIRFFSEHKPAQILITLYGGDEETYERVTGQRKFGIVTESIRKLIQADVQMKVAVTPSRYMGEGVFEAVRAASSFGIPFVVNSLLFDPKEETGRSGQVHNLALEDYVRVLQYLNDLRGIKTREISSEHLPPPGGPCHECGTGIPCRAGRSSFTLEWDGKMHPCASIRDIVSDPLIDGFQAAWNSLLDQCRNWQRIPECKDCPYEQVCIKCSALKAQFTRPGARLQDLCSRTMYLVQKGVAALPDCDDVQG